MFIQTETTPNPATIKFLPGEPVLSEGSMEFAEPNAATGVSPLAERLFALQGVERIFLGQDFISISKAGDTDWAMLKPMVLAALMEFFSLDLPVLTDGAAAQNGAGTGDGPNEDDDEITQQIKELIAERVRPAVMMDGGDIVFDSFEDGVVFLRMRGACSGCPSASATLKMGIENMLRHFIPEVKEVQPIED